ncbi:SDR family NAD(P)-dependent oxidoreductase [Patescibacteria group bacterium]|nr:SDR family NAD(P)-dependent oxidoreductase [Patescibacteria group bacterium]
MQALQDALGRDNVTYYPCDIRDKHALTSIFSQIPEIDCFINNSGIGYRESAVEETLDHIADTIQTNLIGAMRCTNIVLPKMISKKS